MRVCFVSRDAWWQKYRQDILRRLAETLASDVIVLTSGPLVSYIRSGRGVRYVTFRSWLPRRSGLAFFPGAAWHVLISRPDVVFAVNNISNFTEYLLYLICRVRRIPFVWWTHAYDHTAPKGPMLLAGLRRRIMVSALRHSNGVITFSRAGREHLLSRGFAPDLVAHAPNTLDTDLLQAMAARYPRRDRDALCRKLGLREDQRYLIFLGRLTVVKKPLVALDAFRRIRLVMGSVSLLVIGDGPEMGRCKRFVARSGLGGVHFLGAEHDDDRVARYCAVSDLALMPGNLGLSIVHLFALGVPIITERTGQGPEGQYLRHGENAVLVDSGWPHELAAHAIALLRDREMLREMSQLAEKTANGPANVHGMVNAMAGVLKAAAAAGTGPRRARSGA